MNDTELANRVVAQGVGHRIDLNPPHSGTAWVMFEDDLAFLTAESFVRDWRIAGALMEKCWVEISMSPLEFIDFINQRINGKSIHELPRAIILACVEALE